MNSAQLTAASTHSTPPQHGARLRQRRDHQRVPRAQTLVVGARANPPLARLVQPRLDLRQRRRLPAAPLQHVRALEVAAFADAEVGDRRFGQGLGAERVAQLRLSPDVVATLDTLRVGVECGVEPAFGPTHLAQRPGECLLAHPTHQRIAADLPAVQVGGNQQRVVIEHLLEVRDGPGRVDGVSSKAAADLVVDAAAGHRAQRAQRHLSFSPREQELDQRCLRELRRAAETAVARVIAPAQAVGRSVQRGRGDRRIVSRQVRDPAERSGQTGSLLEQLGAAIAPRVPYGLDDRRPARHPGPVLGREVGPGEERHLVGRQKAVQRPAALAGHRLTGLHADGVDVGALLAIDLDAHEALVHQRRDCRILERLVGHHVAPMARRVADRDEQRAILGAGALEGLLAPWEPVNGVLRMLEQVGRGLLGKPVGHRFEPTRVLCSGRVGSKAT